MAGLVETGLKTHPMEPTPNTVREEGCYPDFTDEETDTQIKSVTAGHMENK